MPCILSLANAKANRAEPVALPHGIHRLFGVAQPIRPRFSACGFMLLKHVLQCRLDDRTACLNQAACADACQSDFLGERGGVRRVGGEPQRGIEQFHCLGVEGACRVRRMIHGFCPCRVRQVGIAQFHGQGTGHQSTCA